MTDRPEIIYAVIGYVKGDDVRGEFASSPDVLDIHPGPSRYIATDAPASAFAALPQVQAAKPTEIERLVWQAMIWSAQQPPPAYGAAFPDYTNTGNSDAEIKARDTAARIRVALDRMIADAVAKETERLRDALASIAEYEPDEYDHPLMVIVRMAGIARAAIRQPTPAGEAGE